MATFIELSGGRVQARIRNKSQNVSKVFDSRTEAEYWVKDTEISGNTGGQDVSEIMDLLETTAERAGAIRAERVAKAGTPMSPPCHTHVTSSPKTPASKGFTSPPPAGLRSSRPLRGHEKRGAGIWAWWKAKQPACPDDAERERVNGGEALFAGIFIGLVGVIVVFSLFWWFFGPWPLTARADGDTSRLWPSVGVSLGYIASLTGPLAGLFQRLGVFQFDPQAPYADAIAKIVSWTGFFSFGVGVFGWLRAGGKERGALKDRHISGKRLLNCPADINKRLEEEIKVHGKGINLHPLVPISRDRETRHFLVSGAVGSGKTQILRTFMNGVFERMQTNPADRMIIYDNKSDVTEGLPVPDGEMVLFAPWDSRTWAWDIGKDVVNVQDAATTAARLIPEQQGSGEAFWNNASRQIVEASICLLQNKKQADWDWFDLAHQTTTIEGILEATKQYQPLLFEMLSKDGENKTRDNLLVNTGSFLQAIKYLSVAWCNRDPYSGAEVEPGRVVPKLSLRAWALEPTVERRVLVLQGNKRYGVLEKSYIQSIISAFFSILASPEMTDSKARRIWMFLDEFPQLGKLDNFLPFLEVGRSKGVCVLIGLQDPAQFRVTYGKDLAEVFLGVAGTYIVCRSEGAAKTYFSKTLGEKVVERKQVTESGGGNTTSRTTSKIQSTKPVVTEDQISRLGAGRGGVLAVFAALDKDPVRLRWPYVSYPKRRAGQVPARWTEQ